MSRKYISELLSQNFVYPNNTVSEYDLEIVHDINNYSVSGTVTNFTGTLVSSTGITINMSGTWSLNNAEPYVNQSGTVNIFSVHMMDKTQNYYRPWSLVYNKSITTGLTSYSFSQTFTVTPSMVGVTGFTTGNYYFEVRMIGHRSIFPICVNIPVTSGPTPTPSPTVTGPTATPTPSPSPTVTGPTATPTPSPTVTGTLTPTPTITGTLTPTPTSGATSNLFWSFSETASTGNMELYINGSIVENRYANSSGTITVNLGDTIRVKITTSGCVAPNNIANSYCLGILNEGACDPTVVELTSTLYTVVSGDIGTTISLASFSSCDTGCV